MSTFDPLDLRRTKQLIRCDKLLHIGKEAGFVFRNSGGSHWVGHHPVHKDLQLIIVQSIKSPAYQRDLSDALVEIRRRELAATSRDDFTTATKNNSAAIEHKIPSYISAEYDHQTGHTVLRDKQIPQIGLTIKPGEEHLLENKVRYLESLKRQAFIMLNRARIAYDIDVDVKHGVFSGTLSHSIYDLPALAIKPYQKGGNPEGFFAEVGAYINQVTDIDLGNKNRLASALNQSFVKATMVCFTARRGERTNSVIVENEHGSSFRLSFVTASNRRADTSDVYGGRISERELSRLENVMRGVANSHATRTAASLGLRAA